MFSQVFKYETFAFWHMWHFLFPVIQTSQIFYSCFSNNVVFFFLLYSISTFFLFLCFAFLRWTCLFTLSNVNDKIWPIIDVINFVHLIWSKTSFFFFDLKTSYSYRSFVLLSANWAISSILTDTTATGTWVVKLPVIHSEILVVVDDLYTRLDFRLESKYKQ